MGFAELIQELNELPLEKQAEVVDFARFIREKYKREQQTKVAQEASLFELINKGVTSRFQPLSREEANAR